ncbi:MAG TPA: (2Fe-2S)-binding protein [Anaeromyxobacteraceae bacterium]|nr:(2Fe-2S)-binding protein [Anaeromyxobacteraceae bacterium]
MIVCVCHAVSDARMRELVATGASELEIVGLTRAGTSCGCCVDAMKALVGGPRPACGKDVPCPGCECLDEGGGVRAA